MALEATIERAARQAERLGRLAHVPLVPLQRFLDEHAFHFVQCHLLKRRRGRVVRHAQAQIGGQHHATARQQDRALDRVFEFAHVAWPRMAEQGLECALVETLEDLAITRGMPAQEMPSEFKSDPRTHARFVKAAAAALSEPKGDNHVIAESAWKKERNEKFAVGVLPTIS